MGLKIRIFSPGKTKEPWLQMALAEYEKRLTGLISIVWEQGNVFPQEPYICLDPKGTELTSPAFSTFLYNELEKRGSRIAFLIGGPDGIPLPILEKASSTISLSRLTFTHQLARLLFLEQVYRATQIHKGTKYHK